MRSTKPFPDKYLGKVIFPEEGGTRLGAKLSMEELLDLLKERGRACCGELLTLKFAGFGFSS